MDPVAFRTRYNMTPFEAQTKVAIRALKDPTFRARTVSHPKAAMQEECGVELPPGFDLKVLQMTESYLPVVLPEPFANATDRRIEDIERLLVTNIEEQPREVREQVTRQARLLSRVWTDSAFKRDLMDSPKPWLQRELGVRVPDHITVEAFEESESTGYLILLASPNTENGELSDEQLDTIAGGLTVAPVLFFTLWIAAVVTATVIATITVATEDR